MKTVTPYLIFNGNCKEAVNFYNSHLGGELFMTTYGEAPQTDCPSGAENKIIHANLKKGDFNLMASDTPTGTAHVGDNIQLYLHCESREEVEKIYKGLSEGGTQKVPLNDTFWGAYFGMFTDKFGINWMLGFELPRK
ncbi:VOC family protein [Bacteriovorax sp. PP10]|uniref:VOC family protein n=1 Tax=Bacteriovorax antarcticus TaxID=3088717 RepID=A0ABU5VW73_9BACT|nr:VOC family protein [Bacteriovorax sp. PP10]MEA9357309.1 VOC family protein [Bacteriovorax sp. PP10]